MTGTIRKFSPDDAAAHIALEIRTSGVAIIENLFSPEAIGSLCANLNPTLDSQEPGGGEFFGNLRSAAVAQTGRYS